MKPKEMRDRHYDPKWVSLFIFVAVCITLFIHQLLTQMVDHTPEVIFNGDSPTLSVSYLDVGDADCILVKAPSGESALIDTGTRNMRTRITTYLKDMGVESLDYMILTHYHEDHAECASALMEHLPVRNLILPNSPQDSPLAQEIVTIAQKNSIPIQTCIAGGRIQLGEAFFTFLADGSEHPGDPNCSIVSMLRYQAKTFLFTGDAEEYQEHILLEHLLALKSDVLKVAHHGSSSSSGEEFIRSVSPSFAIVSVSNENPSHLPNHRLRSQLEAMGCQILTTADNGNIRVVTDGEKIKVFSEK